MEAPLVTTLLIVLVVVAWHVRFVRATRVRRAEAFSRDCMRVGAALLAFGVIVFGGRAGAPTEAEMLATVFFDVGGVALLFLGLAGWATSNDTAICFANLTDETLVFVDAEGELLFTLLPQFGRAVMTLPPPLPNLYLIVPPALLETAEAATRTDLRVVDVASARRTGSGDRLLVRRLRTPTHGNILALHEE